MKKFQSLIILLIFILVSGACSMQEKGGTGDGPYVWKNVQVVGGGFVPGIIFHPTEPGLRYCRTDMGGAYRWNTSSERWEPLLDWLSYEDRNLMGVESIALDPSDPDMLFLACGTYTNPSAPNGAVLWSDDRGETFNRTDLPFKLGGNENGRGNGERMAVDPNDGDIIYLGTRHDGLWRSTDRALTWQRVESFPDVKEEMPEASEGRNSWRLMQEMGSGIIFVLFDPAGGKEGKSHESTEKGKNQLCQVIYAGVSLMGRESLFRSTDGGETWIAVPGQPTEFRPTHGILASNGVMYITYGTNPGPWPMRNGAVWKLDTRTDSWTDITPDKPDPDNGRAFGYAAVSADPSNPDVVIASTYHRYSAGGDELFRSIDGGQSWKPIFESGTEFDYSKAPYIKHTGVHWMFDVEIDPADPDHAMITTGYGGHETFNLTDVDRGEPVVWHVMSSGIEETVPLDLLSPPKGGQVITAVGDYCGFVHYDLDRPVPQGCFENPHFGNTNGIACAELKPEVIVRVGIEKTQNPDENIGYSLDAGKSWQPTPTMPFPEARHGHIAVSADGESWVWTPWRSGAYVTTDRGESWSPIETLPENTRIIADRINPEVFYGLGLFEGKLYISDDRGFTFASHNLDLPGGTPERPYQGEHQSTGRGDSRGGQDRIYATPGRSGDIWLAAFHGLFHAENTGGDISGTGFGFVRMPGIEEIHGFGFGAPAPGSDEPALYLIGTVDGVSGIFRSDNFGQHWLRINDDQHQWGLLMHITGDPKKYGRVYIGTHGRGTIYGDPR